VAELKSRLELPRGSRPGLPHARPLGADALRRRSAAHPPAAQLGSNLRGVCYILDEPTIGLHHRDNKILLDVLEKLEARALAGGGRARRGHHPPRPPYSSTSAPGAGKLGGYVVAEGRGAAST
jgi:excinuclease ABC subunit A